jgi:hypothetical protein
VRGSLYLCSPFAIQLLALLFPWQLVNNTCAGAAPVATLQPCALHAEPWAGQVHISTASTRPPKPLTSSATSLRNTRSGQSETAGFGFKWLSEQIKHWDGAVVDLLDKAGPEHWDSTLKVVKKHQGPLWVAMYLMDVWEQDLHARLQVRAVSDRFFFGSGFLVFGFRLIACM